MHYRTNLLAALVFLAIPIQAQIKEGNSSSLTEEEPIENGFKHHRIMVVLGHANTPEGINEEGQRRFLTLASWGLDYDFRFNEKWSVGIHSDFVVENFTVEYGETIKQRRRPIAVVLSGSRKFGKHFTLLAGAGGEFSKGEEDFALIRLGADYGWELPKDWELAISLMNDYKFDGYFSWVLGIGIGKLF